MSDKEFVTAESEVIEVPDSRFPLSYSEDGVSFVCGHCNAGLRFSRVGDSVVDAVYVAERILEFAKGHTPCTWPSAKKFTVTL